MATKTAYRSRSQGNYITPNTAEGKKILNYLRNRCEKALDYCLENGLTSVEDFADAIEELTEADGKPGISVEVKHNGLVLSLSDRPEYGSTTGKYMMEHLGEPDDNRFTKTGIEALLDSPRTKTRSKKDDLLDELEDEEPSPPKSKAATKSRKDDLLDELEDEEPLPRAKSKSATKFKKDDLLDELEDEEPLPRAKSKTNTKSKKDEIKTWEYDEPSANSKNKARPRKDDLEELESEELLLKSKALTRSPRDELSELDEFELKEPQSKAKPQTKSHLQNYEREDLSDEELSAKSQAKRKLQTNEGVEVAESLARTPSKTRTSQQGFQGKKSNDQNIDSILDAAVQVSGRTAISGSEVEGTTVSGLSTQVAVLATLMGKKAASQIIEAALGAVQERQVAGIVKRLQAQSQRADSLSQRVTNLAEADSMADATVESEALPIAEPEPEPEQNILPEPDAEFVSTPGMLLAKAVSKVHGKVDKISGRVRDNNSEKTTSIKIDTEASFEEQLVQINEALNRLEKRLDTLEQRIEALENKFSLQKSETGVQAGDAKLEPPDSSTPSFSDQFVQNGTEIGEKISLESTIPASSSASATAKKITVTAQNLTQDAQLAATLAKIYNLAEEEANAEGIALEDGVDLGEAKLYITNFDSSTAVSLKTKEGEELFSAVQDKTGEWKVTNDFLKPEEKEELDRLKIFQQALNQERLAFMVKRSNQDEVSFTDSQGSRLDFEVEFNDKSKSKGTVKGFNSHSEIVFEASLQKGNVEVLLCDIPPEVVENLLSQQQLAPNQNSNKQEARKTETEMEI